MKLFRKSARRSLFRSDRNDYLLNRFNLTSWRAHLAGLLLGPYGGPVYLRRARLRNLASVGS